MKVSSPELHPACSPSQTRPESQQFLRKHNCKWVEQLYNRLISRYLLIKSTPTYLCEIPVTIIVKRMKHFLCPSHRLIPEIYFLSINKISVCMCALEMLNVLKIDNSVSWCAVSGIPGEVILEDHDKYLDHLLELYGPRPVLVIQTELPPELLLRRTRGLGSDQKHRLRQILSSSGSGSTSG